MGAISINLKDCRGTSSIAIVVILLVVTIIVISLFYIAVLSLARSSTSKSVGSLIMLGYKTHPGAITIFVLPSTDMLVKTLLLEYPNGTVYCVENIPGNGIKLRRGTINIIPIIFELLKCSRYPIRLSDKMLLEISPSNSLSYSLGIIDTSSLSLSNIPKSFRIVLFTDLSTESSGSVNVNLAQDAWSIVIMYPLLGAEIGYYHYGGIYLGEVMLVSSGNSLDLRKMDIEKVLLIGPFIEVINPTFATKDWTFSLTTITGYTYTFTLPKLVNDRREVLLDVLILYEDSWAPGIASAPPEEIPSNVIDNLNWNDTVIRITFFTNDTVRIHVLVDEGQHLHALFIEPPAPKSFDENVMANYLNTLANDVQAASNAIGQGENYVSKLGLYYIKPYDYINEVYLLAVWDQTHQLTDITKVVFLCNIDTGKCTIRNLS